MLIKTKLKINFLVFILSLFVGLLFVYITNPTPEIIIRYPSINNAHKTIYNDDKNMCYNFIPQQIECE